MIYQEVSNVSTTVVYGDGDVYSTVGVTDDLIALLIYQGEQVNVGDDQKDAGRQPAASGSFPVRLVFKNEKSLDILIEKLTRLKKFFEEKESEQGGD